MERIILVSLLLGAVVAWGQQERKLTPREIFYSAPPVPASAKGGQVEEPAKKPAIQAAKPKPARKSTAATQRKQEPLAGRVESIPTERPLVPVRAASFVPLGLRYSILKRVEGGQEEVDRDTVFRAGDRIRLSVEANDSAYLYIVNRGSSGTWKVLFPSPEIAGGDNRVERGRRYEIPAGYTFTFDEQPGMERLFIVLSRQPEADLEQLIYSLEKGRPAAQPAEPRQSLKVLVAQNLPPVDDALVGKLRVYSRDLIIEKVDETTAGGPAREKAVYTVNPSGAADSRVVADLSLTHR